MCRKYDLTASEKSVITSELAKDKSTLEIFKIIGRYHQTVKYIITAPTKILKRVDEGQSRAVSQRSLLRFKREAVKNPGLTSREQFKHVGVKTASRTTRCHLLKNVCKPVTSVKRTSLNKLHVQNHLKWAEDNMKVDFSKVLITDETRAALDGSDGRIKGWVVNGRDRHQHLRRQQRGGGIMIWADIIGDILVGPWKVPDRVKMTADAYIIFPREHIEPWLKKAKDHLQDNHDIHARYCALAFSEELGFCGSRKINWPACSPD
ncbi:uncharacterized protein LOC115216572 [Octopus sinensis]|uniref:Uncharacterized protein LOC115216572 n=1 Tax=Octopus sinensis TaxID=2607531 RepID=A0A6P7SUL7_9MOLL|nr:uncharacterized protein LOC115216572 [Octopus sinensis]